MLPALRTFQVVNVRGLEVFVEILVLGEPQTKGGQTPLVATPSARNLLADFGTQVPPHCNQ